MTINSPMLEPTRKARIEIIPLIDVVFFLLATFVLFTLSLSSIRTINVPMPKAGIARDGDDTVYIQATDGGAYYWKLGPTAPAELISAAEIRPRLQSYATSVARPRVLVRGDEKAKYGAAVFLLDQVRLVGIKELSVETFATPAGS